ncbi:MAG: AsnC family protein [Promethearchaeota archaeon]
MFSPQIFTHLKVILSIGVGDWSVLAQEVSAKIEPKKLDDRLFWDQQLIQAILQEWQHIHETFPRKTVPFQRLVPASILEYEERFRLRFQDHPAVNQLSLEEDMGVILSFHPYYFNFPYTIFQAESYNQDLYLRLQQFPLATLNLCTFLKVFWQVWRSTLPALDLLDKKILSIVLGKFQPIDVLGRARSPEIQDILDQQQVKASIQSIKRHIRRLHQLGIISSRPVYNHSKLGLIPVLKIAEQSDTRKDVFDDYWFWRHPIAENKMIYLATPPWQLIRSSDKNVIVLNQRVQGLNFNLYNEMVPGGWQKQEWLNNQIFDRSKAHQPYKGSQLELQYDKVSLDLTETDIKLLTSLQLQGRDWRVHQYASELGLTPQHIYRRLQRLYQEELYKHLFVFQVGLDHRIFFLGRNLGKQKQILINYLTQFPRYFLFEGESDFYAIIWVPGAWMTEIIDQSALLSEILDQGDISMGSLPLTSESQVLNFAQLWDSESKEFSSVDYYVGKSRLC